MSPDTIEAVRCALQTVCETGGTMDELALIEQADRIADLEQQLVRQDDYYMGDRKRIANLEQELKDSEGRCKSRDKVIYSLEQQLADVGSINLRLMEKLVEVKAASKTTALEIYRHSAMRGSEEGFLSYWDSAVESRMQLLKEQDNGPK